MTRARGAFSALAGLALAFAGARAAADDPPVVELPVVEVGAVSLPAGRVGTPYAVRIAADTAGEWTFRARRRRLPPGLTLRRDGALVGTPKREGEATFPVRMRRRGRPRLTLRSLFTLDVRGPAAWTRLGAVAPPAARWGHAGALDVRRGRLVVFGGGSGVNWLNDAHALDLATGAWERLGDDAGAPPGRWGHTLVVDEASDRAVLFGGMSVAPLGDVWALDLAGGEWRELQPAGPAPEARRGHAAAFDPATGRMLVFGGSGLAGDLADCWALDLRRGAEPVWTRVEASGTAPSPRTFASGALDRAPGRWYLVGGAGAGGASDEVHALDLAARGGAARALLEPGGDGPGALTSAVAAFDPRGRALMVFGGDASGTLRGTVHALVDVDPAAPRWEALAEVDPAGPGARAAAVGVLDPATSRLIVAMGNDGALRDDVWALAVEREPAPSAAWTAQTPAGPSARMNHTLVEDPERGRLVLFGGFDGAYRDDTWSLDLAAEGGPAWTELVDEDAAPRRRFAHASVLDSARDRMLVVAGSDGTSGSFAYFADVWSLDLAAPAGVARWREIVPGNSGPAPRDEHVAVLDAANDRVLVHGGFDDFTVFADLWALDLASETWSELTPVGEAPSGRAGAAAVYDPVHRRMLLHGGGDGAGFLEDLWALDLAVPGAARWARLALPGAPAGRSLHVLAWDPAGPAAVLAGGQALGPFTDAFRLVLDAPTPRWERLADPPARSSAAAAWDPATRGLVLHGGLAPNLRSEVLRLSRR